MHRDNWKGGDVDDSRVRKCAIKMIAQGINDLMIYYTEDHVL